MLRPMSLRPHQTAHRVRQAPSRHQIATRPWHRHPPKPSHDTKLFVDPVLGCRPDHFQPTDAPLLAAYCRAVCLEQTASSELAAAGFVIDGRPSGWLNILAQATRTISTYSRMLRLNPAGRQPTPASTPEPISRYDRIAFEVHALQK